MGENENSHDTLIELFCGLIIEEVGVFYPLVLRGDGFAMLGNLYTMKLVAMVTSVVRIV